MDQADRIRMQEAVAKGAALLDEYMPNWYRMVDEYALDMRSCRCCIAGQVMIVQSLRADIEAPGAMQGFSGEYGFDVAGDIDYDDVDDDGNLYPNSNPDECWTVLEAEWLRVINERLAAEKRLTRRPRVRGSHEGHPEPAVRVR